MSTTADRVRDYWQRTNTVIRPGLSSNEIAQFEAKHNIALPLAVASFYRTMDGTDEVGDENLLTVWPLSKVMPATDELGDSRALPNAAEYFIFADFLIDSHFYAVRLSSTMPETTPVIWLGVWPSRVQYGLLANTWDAFWERYLSHPDDIIRLVEIPDSAM